MRINQILPDVLGVNTNMNVFPYTDSAGRLYMQGNMLAKSVVVSGAGPRRIEAGFEKQYGNVARNVIAPSNMTVEEIFWVRSSRGDGILSDGWKEIFVVFKNEDKNYYDLLILPKFNSQNTYIGFEYRYDKEMLSRLEPGATFGKGEVFAESTRIAKDGTWTPTVDTKVAAVSRHGMEEDAIEISDRYAEEKLLCIFKHDRGFEYNESDWIPTNLNGTIDDPRLIGECGTKIREDGIIMGFRRREGCNPLVSLTKRGLMEPDLIFDKMFYAPPSSVVMDVVVQGEKLKDRSHNRSTNQIPQQHTYILKEHESAQNTFYGEIITWYERACTKNNGVEPDISYPLDLLIRDAYGKHTSYNGKLNDLQYSYKKVRQKDWKIKVLLKERVSGQVKFKFAGMNGDKSINVKIKPWREMFHYSDGTYSDVHINNTPAFRRQIMGMLIEATVNFIGMELHKDIVSLRDAGNYDKAWELLYLFYSKGFPEFATNVVDYCITNNEERNDHIDYVCKEFIAVQHRPDSKVYGVDVVRSLREVFSYKPRKALFTNEFGQEVETHFPVLITSLAYMMLDKFGADDSSQSFPKANPFGLPKSNSPKDKHTNYYIDKGSRNLGEAESRWEDAQVGAKETVRQLTLANSELVRNNAVKRIIRADNAFDIDQIVKDSELSTNRAVIMAAEYLSDSAYALRHELPEDRI